MRAKLITANWKMNGSYLLIKEMFKSLSSLLEKDVCEIVICPPDVLLFSMMEIFGESRISFGSQNVHSETEGAFTGETSARLLRECGAKWCIVGHSERREWFSETDEFIRRKIDSLLRHEIRPIICVGETLKQRESGEYEEIVVSQLRSGMAGLNVNCLLSCVVAYEPIWAIGSGKTATPEQANTMHEIIRRELALLSSKENAEKIRILYGGSVNPENAGILLSQEEIDGALVGGASLKSKDFKQIIEAAN